MDKIKQQNEKTRELLTEHLSAYPMLQIDDVFKFLYHSACGCEHLVSDKARVLEYIKREYATLVEDDAARIDILDGEYIRAHLSLIDLGLGAEELAEMFLLSAVKEPSGIELLEQKLEVAREMVAEGILPFDAAGFEAGVSEWRRMGYPAIHHSEVFRREYHPAYRVVSRRYLPYLSQLCEDK